MRWELLNSEHMSESTMTDIQESFSLDTLRRRFTREDSGATLTGVMAWVARWPLLIGAATAFAIWVVLHYVEAFFLGAVVNEIHWNAFDALRALVLFIMVELAFVGFAVVARRIELAIAEKLNATHHIQAVSINGFAEITERRDPSTGKHIRRIGFYSRLLAETLAQTPKYSGVITHEYIRDIWIAAPLHDIGKVGVADAILKKRARLSLDEYEIMKMHAIIGGDLMAELERQLPYKTFYSLGKEIAYHHHQKWNGTGYPNVFTTGNTQVFFVQSGVGRPLRGEEIPLSARIMAVADVYDALVSRRVYKDAFTHVQAREMILSERGEHFDPDVVDAFIKAEPQILAIAEDNRD